MKIPKKIFPCPIIESIIEIRFNSQIPSEAIFGIIYNEFKDDYPVMEKLSILQIPEQLRLNDPNLRYKPTHKLTKDNILLQIGPHSFSLVNTHEYIGWTFFSEIICDVFSRLFKIIAFKKISRVAVRYVNLFKELNIFDKSNMQIILNNESFVNNEINMTSVVNTKDCIHRLLIVNKAEVVVANKHYAGSLIDIDTVLRGCPIDISKDVNILMDCIGMAHVDEKILFFSLIEKSFLETLNPEY